jgi:hypothetical protein
MTKNIKLLLSASTVAMFSIAALQGCGSDTTSGGPPSAGAPGAGSGAGGAPSAGAPSAGAPSAGAPSAGAPSAGAPSAGAPSAGAGGGATAGAGGASGGSGGAGGGAGGAKGGAGGAAGAGGAKGGAGGGGGASGAAGAGGGSAGAGGGDGRDCATFCSDETATCGTMAYASSAACMTACTGYALGAIASLPNGPTGTNTYACRRWHLSKAATYASGSQDRMDHCGHTASTSSTCM